MGFAAVPETDRQPSVKEQPFALFADNTVQSDFGGGIGLETKTGQGSFSRLSCDKLATLRS